MLARPTGIAALQMYLCTHVRLFHSYGCAGHGGIGRLADPGHPWLARYEYFPLQMPYHLSPAISIAYHCLLTSAHTRHMLEKEHRPLEVHRRLRLA